MSIVLQGSTSGSITLQEPAIAGTTTLNLPASSGTVVVGSSAVSSAGQIPFSTDGLSYTPTAKIVSATAVASTSGTSIDFTGIPSWVKRVTVMFNDVSTNGFSAVLIQLGSGSVTSSGYAGSCFSALASSGYGVTNYTTGFGIGSDGGSGYVRQGAVSITLQSPNVWVCSGSIGQNETARMSVVGGAVSLSGVLDRVRITTVNGTDTFDVGSINILYE